MTELSWRAILVFSLAVGLVIPSVTAAADPADPAAWQHVSVTMVDGVEHRDVTLTWALEGYSIKLVSPEGEETLLSPTRIVAILDSGGHEITDQVADASPATDASFALLGEGRVTPFLFDLMLTVGVSGTMNKGEGSFHFGGAALAGARISLGSRTHIHLLYRRQGITEEAHGYGGTISTNANELNLLFGLRLNHPRKNNNYSYIEMGLSLIGYDNRFNEESGAWVGGGVSGPGVTVQGGVVIPFSSRVGLDLGGIFMVRPPLVEDSRDPGLLFGLNAALALSW